MGNLYLPPWNPSYPLARRRRKPPLKSEAFGWSDTMPQ